MRLHKSYGELLRHEPDLFLNSQLDPCDNIGIDFRLIFARYLTAETNDGRKRR